MKIPGELAPNVRVSFRHSYQILLKMHGQRSFTATKYSLNAWST